MPDWAVHSGTAYGYVHAQTIERAFELFLDQTDCDCLGLIASFMDVSDPDPGNILYASVPMMLRKMGVWHE